MKITLNNNPETFNADKLTIKELLKIKNYTFRMLIIKINGKLIIKDEYDIATVSEGDDVNVIHLISGG